jgi:hypothetical protein
MIGLVAEGAADIAVVRNILKGKLGIDRDLTYAIRPELAEDATDLGERRAYRDQRPEEFGNWTLVLEECRKGTQIEDFLRNQIDEDSFVVVQIDTAEAHLPAYDVVRPARGRPDYVEALRALVVAKIAALLGPELEPDVRHAVAVEETDAWVLTIHDGQDERDTGLRLDPKKRLRYVMVDKASDDQEKRSKGARLDSKKRRPGVDEREAGRGKTKAPRRKEHDLYDELSRDFRDPNTLEACAARNRSLRLFLDSLTPPASEG